MKVYEIAHGHCPIRYWDKFYELLVFAKNENIRNARNYQELEFEIEEHDAFHILVDDDEDVVGFAGLYNPGHYPANTARILNRAYYSPKVRHKSLATHGGNHIEKALLARYIVPQQLAIARNDGRESVFFSVEFPMRRKSVQTIVKWMNEHHDHGGKWVILDRMYNTCRGWIHEGEYQYVDKPTCWQNIAIMYFDDRCSGLNLPSITIEEWHAKFGHTKR